MASLALRPIAAAAAVLLVSSVSAQSAPPGRCADALAEAERAYVERAYETAESLALDCTFTAEPSPADLKRAHRLLALTYIKADRLADARLMVVRIVAADVEYAADPTADLPAYVALVDAVRAQLRVSDAVPVGAVPAAAVSPAAVLPENGEPPAAASATRVNVNTADAEALDSVPGIGPALAGRILRHRNAQGPFRHVAELEAVRGIGPRSLERMEPYLTVGSGRVVVPAVIPAAPEVSAQARINVNTASATELEALPRIGPALARRIVAFRTNYGAFRSVDELELVRGIGPRTIEGFEGLVTVE